MKKYRIEFEVIERYVYSTVVEAKSAKHALELFEDDPCKYDSIEDVLIDSENVSGSAECIGQLITDKNDPRLSTLKRFKNPIKLNK